MHATAAGQLASLNQTMTTRSETPFSRLSHALDQVLTAEKVTCNLAGRLVGDRATAEGKGDVREAFGLGMFGEVERVADDIINAAARICGDISRIESKL